MAIDIATEYPGKVDTSDPTNYPNGKARNVSAPGDGTGTPFRAPVLNDLIQINYALLAAAGITPSGTPDSVTTNQVFEAMQKLNGRQVFTADGTFNTPSWVKRIKVTAVGAGGAGGATDSTDPAGGGGSGGIAVAIIDNPAASYAVTVGLGGAQTAAGADTNGASGGDSTFGGGALLTAEGGAGGDSGASGWGGLPGGFSGTAASILSEYGQRGGAGADTSLSFNHGGVGGHSRYGRQGGRGASIDATGYGAGGGGAAQPVPAGGAGAPGLVIVEWGIGI